MTEVEWLAGDQPGAMLAYLLEITESVYGYPPERGRKPSDRKLRLFATACWRATFTDEADVVHAEDGEAMADGLSRKSRGETWLTVPDASDAARWAIEKADGISPADQANLFRDIIANPFRPVALCGCTVGLSRTEPVPDCLACQRILTPTVLSLTRAAHDSRFPDGTLDPARLAVLSDALEEAGCTDGRLLLHLRGGWCPDCMGQGKWKEGDASIVCCWCDGTGGRSGPHVRGCWAVDLVLGLE